jgi:predicted transcriptional regulator
MHKYTRNLCRNLNIDKSTLQRIITRPEVQSDAFSKFIKYLNELKSQVQQRLMTTVEDEAANRTMLHELTERERKAEESQEALQTKLAEVREEKDHVTFSLDQILRKLQVNNL